MTFGELFAGIGGFSLGLERAGMTCKWQVEIDPYATAVLKKHWPDVPKHDDVRTFPPTHDDYSVDLICGGFPCQDISVAGKGAGLAGERSGLWNDFARVIRTVWPNWVVIENVPALTSRGLGTVLGDLAEMGFDAEWHCIPASAVGAPHRRERIWIVAHAISTRARNPSGDAYVFGNRVAGRHEQALPQRHWQAEADRPVSASEDAVDVADAKGVSGWPGLCEGGPQQDGHKFGDRCCHVPHANRAGRQQQRRTKPVRAEQLAIERSGWWESEPDVGRVAHGVPSRVDRLRCLGNAVVPQVVEIIGRAILEAEARMTT